MKQEYHDKEDAQARDAIATDEHVDSDQIVEHNGQQAFRQKSRASQQIHPCPCRNYR